MFGQNQITAGSLALVRGTRAFLGTFRGDGAFVALATRTVIPVFADDVFTSRGNVMNAAVRRGSALLTGSTISIAPLALNAKRFYVGPADAIRYATVFDQTSEADKAALIESVTKFYALNEA